MKVKQRTHGNLRKETERAASRPKNAADWTVSRPTGMGVDGKTNGFEWARKRIIGHGFSAAVRATG